MGYIYLLLLKRSLRGFFVVLLVSAVFTFGHLMTPRDQGALARVYLDAADSLSSPGVPEYMKFQVDEGKVQEVYLNDNHLFYTLNRTDKNIDQLLDYYENMYSGHNDLEFAPPGAMEEVLKRTPKGVSKDAHRKRIEKTHEVLNDRFFRFNGDGWGGFSTIVTGKEGASDYNVEITERFMKLKESGLAEDLGDAKVVVAFDDPSTDETQYFNVWPDGNFDLRKMQPRDGEDAPGFDIEDIDRPTGATRQLTFAQDHGGARYTILVYRGKGTISGVLDDFAMDMSSQGWTASAAFESARARVDDFEPALLMAKGGREAYVSLRANRGEGTVTSTIIVYDQPG